VRIIDGRRPRDLLAIGNLRRADIRVDLVGATEHVDLDIEMQFAHALENGLAGLRIGGDDGTTDLPPQAWLA
jgi:hypothetical protein